MLRLAILRQIMLDPFSPSNTDRTPVPPHALR